MDASQTKLTLIFDDNCPLCVRFKQSFERVYQDEIRFRPLSDESVFSDFPFLTPEGCSKDLHLVQDEQNFWVGAEALSKLVSHFPYADKFKWLYESDNGKKAVDYFYAKTHELRERLKSNCPGCS